MTTPIMTEMFEVLRQSLNKEYAALLPEGGEIQRIALYDPQQHTAPNLLFKKKENPNVKYIATIEYATASESGCCSCLGETVNDAIKAAIAKIGENHVRN